MGYAVTIFASAFPGCLSSQTLDGVTILREGTRLNVHGCGKEFYVNAMDQFDMVVDEINTKPFMTPTFVRKPKVALIHQLAREYWNYEVTFPGNLLGFYFLESYWLKKYRDVPTVTVSRSTEGDLLELGFRQVSVIREGLSYRPIDSEPPKAPIPTVLYLGRLTRAKRVDLLLEAFAQVKHSVANAELLIAGDGYLLDKLRKEGQDGVTFLGRIPSADVTRLLQRAWVLVYPSIREGFGLSIIEANAHGTPAIGFDVPGVRDAIRDGETGILVTNGDVSEMANALLSMVRDSSLRHRMSKAALAYSRTFSWDATAAEFAKILEAVSQGVYHG